jgi:hypothetical protein
MKFYFLFAIPMMVACVSALELRNETNQAIKPPGTIVTGIFPAIPVYASFNYFDGGCGTALSQVENVLTGACFSNGFTSEKFTCSK